MRLRFIHGSIRKKLVYIVILATLPVFVVLLSIEFQKRNDAVRSAEHDTIIFLRGFSEVQRRITDSTRTLLRTVSELPEIKRRDVEGATRILATLLRANPMYTNAILLSIDGSVVAMGKGQDKGFNFADRKQFKDALATREFAFGEHVIGKATQKNIFPFAMPVLDALGEPQGVIIIGVDLTHYAALFDKSDYPEGAFFGLCDHNGIRLFRHPEPTKATAGLPIKKQVFDAARGSREAGILATQGSDGVQRIIAYEPIRLNPEGPPYMYMFMGLDRNQVLAAANKALAQSVVASIVSLCLALTLAWLLGRKTIAAEIDKLTRATRRLGRGGSVIPTGVPYTDGEIGQLAESFDTMSAILQKREEDLQAAKDCAETANKTKDEFLANISHEVRTPLNGVMGMLQLLQETAVNDEQESFVSTALHSSKNLMRVLNDLLDFIKVGAGKLELFEEAFDLQEMVEQSVNLFQLHVEEKGVTLSFHIEPGTQGRYIGDVGRIRQIIFNLLGNAIKFTESGSIEVQVYTLPHPGEDKERLFFSIEDTGVGIPDDKIEYIFDAFTQVDGSLSRGHQGTGLGLPIVKKLVNLMKGNCVIESEVGIGTTVLFCVLVEKAPETAPAAAIARHQPVSRKLNVLLVEDERVNSLMAQRLLEKMGHSVACAETGRQCLDFLSLGSFDIILMDIQMPVMNGLEATRIIRTNPEYSAFASIPIIALSAHASEKDRQSALAVGVNDYITKPFEKESLETMMRQLTA